MQDKVLSVSIAAYNVSKTLRQALEPFLAEDVAPFVDVMIVDDGSTDHTADIAKEYIALCPKTFRLISKENGGWGSTLNAGIVAASGKYFKQLDGDDYFSPENLADFLAFLQTTEADLIHTPFIQFEDGSGAIINEIGRYSRSRFSPNQTLRIEDCDNYIPSMHCITVKTELLRKHKITIMENCFYTDLEFTLKVYNSCDTICFYNRPIYYYRLARSGQSMSIIGARKHYKDHVRMLKTILSYSSHSVTSPHKKKNIDKRVLKACALQYVFFFALDCNKQQKQELREYDGFLKYNYPEFYRLIDGRQICILRKTGFAGYKILARQKMRKDKRLKRNFFEG